MQHKRSYERLDTLAAVDPDREWWLRLVAVLTRPRLVFLALRNEDEEDVEARQEPILLVILLAGIAALVLTPAWRSIYDEALSRGNALDGVDVALLTFITGALDGVLGYFVIGGALYLGARSMGSLANWRVARHVLAFACVPLALSAPLLLPVGIGAFGSGLFRKGGDDSGVGGDLFVACQLAFLAWTFVLLLYGVRTTYDWSWPRSAGAVGLLAVFLVIFFVIFVVY
jgi:hypothetical protein